MSDCVACGGPLTPGAYVLPAGSYAKCAACGLASLDPPPSDVGTRRLFVQGYFKGAVPGGYLDYEAGLPCHEANAAARLKLIRRHLGGSPAALVDVGCAIGTFLAAARALGSEVQGVDVSGWAREEAQRRYGLQVEPSIGDVAARRPAHFDVATFFQSLEHMSRPDLALDAANRCLRARGLLVIETWDAGSPIARWMGTAWQQMNPPTVVHLMTRPSLVRLFDRAGFELVAVETTAKLVRAAMVLHVLADKFPRGLGWLDRLGRIPWVGRVLVRYRLGDLITVVARKRGEPVVSEGATTGARRASTAEVV